MECHWSTFQELDLLEQDLRRQLSEVQDTRFAMRHDPAFGFSALTTPRLARSLEMIDADLHRRIWSDSISEGAVTLHLDGTIGYCNSRFAQLVDKAIDELIDMPFKQWIVPAEQPTVEIMLLQAQTDRAESEFHLAAANGTFVPVRLALRPFESEELCGICVVVTDIAEQMRIKDNLLYVSTHDALTGLFNQNWFYTELVRFQRSRAYPVSVAFIDLDNMREVNEKLGHAEGDELLKRATAVLQSAFRVEDIVARVGGDEFAVLLPDTDATTMQNMIGRVRNKLALHNAVHQSPELSFSIGVATAEKGQALSDALKQADQSMYEDKRRRSDMDLPVAANAIRVVDASKSWQFTKVSEVAN
ncbi:MAG: sensor domain-containing diguanylate cyclase [Chloroflexi bacterium]|nr:sensor domain-containing diguanylate cyclase [Chloroflexota bacterium]